MSVPLLELVVVLLVALTRTTAMTDMTWPITGAAGDAALPRRCTIRGSGQRHYVVSQSLAMSPALLPSLLSALVRRGSWALGKAQVPFTCFHVRELGTRSM